MTRRALLTCCAALLLFCGGAAADPAADAPVVLTQGGAQVDVSVVRDAQADSWTLRVKAARDGRAETWNYEYLEPDPEDASAAEAVEIRELRGVPFLFVHAYSGGANCCWSLLAFDLARLKPLGQQLSSRSSIRLRPEAAACGLEAEYQPPKGKPGDKAVRCFDGAVFRKASR